MATRPAKSEVQAIADHRPWKPPEFDPADAAAFQALQRGGATSDQQKRALDWIINKACASYDLSYRPGGEEGRRDTDFAEGKRFVALQIVKLCNIKIGMISTQRRDGI